MTRDAVRLAVAVCTRQRPRMLGELIASLQALDVPQGTELHFIFVENDIALTIGPVVAEFAARTGWPAQAVHAPQTGLSHARNAALDAAAEQGADWLAFVDDDEQVRHDWLRILYAGVREAGAQLGGGPLRPVAPGGGCSDAQADVLDYYVPKRCPRRVCRWATSMTARAIRASPSCICARRKSRSSRRWMRRCKSSRRGSPERYG